MKVFSDWSKCGEKLLRLPGREVTAVRAAGETLTDARIDASTLGETTVCGKPSMQCRLRVKGQKVRYLKASEVAGVRATIQGGKQFRQLEREQQHVQGKLEQLVIKAAELGLELPDSV